MATPTSIPSWTRRPVVAAALRGVMVLGPFVAGWLAIRLTQRFFFSSGGVLGVIVWIAQALVVAVVAGRLIARLADRLTPLHFLLGMTLVFPDQAPSRFRLALRSGTVRRLVAANGASVSDEAQQGAEDAVALVTVLRDHDALTRGHTERVRAYAEMMGTELGLCDADLNKLRWGVLLHDVGKLEVPTEILNKAGRPTAEEWEVLRRHPGAGGKIVLPMASWLGEWSLAAAQHHERWDGGGYPLGLSGSDISLAGRIASVADAYDVVTSRRSYKEPLSAERARQELVDGAGTQFDPDMVRVMLQCGLKRQRTLGAFGWLLETQWVSQLVGGLASLPAAATAAVVAAVAVVPGAASVTAADRAETLPAAATTTAPSTTIPVPVTTGSSSSSEGPASTVSAGQIAAETTTTGPGEQVGNDLTPTTVDRPTTSISPTSAPPLLASNTTPATTSVPAPVVTTAAATTTTTTTSTSTSTSTSTTTTTTTPTTTTTTTVPEVLGDCAALLAGETQLGSANLTGCDFGGVTIDGIDLGGADLSGADLSDVSLSNYNLAGADLTGANLGGTSFADGSMVGATLSGAFASGVEFNRSDLSFIDASDADFSSASLIETSFGFATLDRATFDDAILTGANFNDATLDSASFQRASMIRTEWWRAVAPGAVFSDADLTEAVLGATDLTGASFDDAVLERAVMTDADLTSADLTGTRFTGATGTPASFVAIYDNTVCPDGVVRSATCW